MLWRILRMLLVITIVVTWSSGAALSQAEIAQLNVAVGNGITYQGWLQQDGVAVEGVCDLRFSLFNAAQDGNQAGSTLERPNQTVTGGYFTVNDLDFGPFFFGRARWLEVAVRCPAGSGDFTTLTPRQPLTPAPYALYAINNWSLRGNAATDAATNFVGTTDPVTLTLKVSNTVALRLLPNAESPSVVGGVVGNSVSPGVLGAVIAGGGGPDGGVTLNNRVTDNYGFIGGGGGNQAGDGAGTTADHSFATVGGGRTNSARGALATIGGGQANDAAGQYATVGGGTENIAGGLGATVAGGVENGATLEGATVGGGIENVATAIYATVAGGLGNDATNSYAVTSGGNNNVASGEYATVAGGLGNEATNSAAAVGGGNGNVAGGSHSVVAGGSANQAMGQSAFVGGGDFNEAQANDSTVSGGQLNVVSGESSTISGGNNNQVSGGASTIAGGSNNIMSGNDSVIGGGNYNEVTTSAATIAGGRFNRATADFAAISGGVDAHASHYGEWAHAAGGFANDQNGEAQTSIYILKGTTNNSISNILALNSFGDDLTIAQGRTVVFDIQIAARSAGGESAGFAAQGVIENQLGITSMIGGNFAANVIDRDDATWSVQVAADDSNDSLKITVLGANGDSVRWVATVRTTEVQQQ